MAQRVAEVNRNGSSPALRRELKARKINPKEQPFFGRRKAQNSLIDLLVFQSQSLVNTVSASLLALPWYPFISSLKNSIVCSKGKQVAQDWEWAALWDT